MNEDNKNNANWSFWLISVMALLWSIGGCINYLMQMNIEFVATLPDSHQAIILARPVWATVGFAVGVFGGVIASLLLLFRKSSSLYIFIVSLLGIIVTMIHTLIVANTKIEFTSMESFVMILLPIIVAVILVFYTKRAIHRGWMS